MVDSMTAAVVESGVSDAELLDELRAAWVEVSRGYARCWAAMAEVALHTSTGWEPAEIAAALSFTNRRAEYELGVALKLVGDLPWVHAALAAGELDHHKARVFTSYLMNLTPEQAERICARLVPLAGGWTTSQLAARLLREVQAIDPGYARRGYEQAVRGRGVHGYLDHTGTAVLTGSGLPAAEAAAAAARLEALAEALRAAGYPATVNQTRADLYLRLLDGTLDGLTTPQIQATMLALGPLSPADPDPDSTGGESPPDPGPAAEHHDPGQPPSPHPAPPAPAEPPTSPEPREQPESAERIGPTEQTGLAERSEPGEVPAPGERSAPVEPTEQPGPGGAPVAGTKAGVRFGVEVRVRLSTLLGLDEYPAELAGWGPIPAPVARDLVAAQHGAEWRIAVVDAHGYLVHGDLTRRRPGPRAERSGRGCVGGIVEIAVPEAMLAQLPALAAEHPEWARVLAGISGSWAHRETARAALDKHPHRRFAHAALRRHVQMRDRNCVGVGCRRRAVDSELDHTRDHAHSGPTTSTNNGPCCLRDHTKKHRGGWTLIQSHPGEFTWISPMGQRYHTCGEPLIPDLPQPLSQDPNPNPQGLWMTIEGPILHQPEPPPPAKPTRPPPAPLPDEPPF